MVLLKACNGPTTLVNYGQDSGTVSYMKKHSSMQNEGGVHFSIECLQSYLFFLIGYFDVRKLKNVKEKMKRKKNEMRRFLSCLLMGSAHSRC